jgi:hypothetical protein
LKDLKCNKRIIKLLIINYFDNYHITKKNFTASFYGLNVKPLTDPFSRRR